MAKHKPPFYSPSPYSESERLNFSVLQWGLNLVYPVPYNLMMITLTLNAVTENSALLWAILFTSAHHILDKRSFWTPSPNIVTLGEVLYSVTKETLSLFSYLGVVRYIEIKYERGNCKIECIRL